MKVLFIASYSGTSGANHSLIHLINILKNNGIEPFVVIPKSGKIEELLIENNISYKTLRLFNWITPINGKNFKNRLKWSVKSLINFFQEIRIFFMLKRHKINLIHINAITASWGVTAAKISKIPVVWHVREFLEEDLNKTFWNKRKALRKLNKSDRVITISNSVYKKYSSMIDKNKLITIYNGINHEMYSGVKNPLFSHENVILTIAGRIVKEKGHEEVIYAIEYLLSKGYSKIKLQIVGSEGDTQFISKIKKLVNSLGINNYVSFLGYQKDMVKVWSNTDIALISSKAEAFGRVTVEAMMAGALVIGSDTEGTSELIKGKYGLLYKQGDYKSLAKEIEYAINNKSKMIMISEIARSYAMENFTAMRNAEKIYDLYNNIL